MSIKLWDWDRDFECIQVLRNIVIFFFVLRLCWPPSLGSTLWALLFFCHLTWSTIAPPSFISIVSHVLTNPPFESHYFVWLGVRGPRSLRNDGQNQPQRHQHLCQCQFGQDHQGEWCGVWLWDLERFCVLRTFPNSAELYCVNVIALYKRCVTVPLVCLFFMLFICFYVSYFYCHLSS